MQTEDDIHAERSSGDAIRVLLLSEIFPPQHGGSARWLWEMYRRLDDVDVIVVAGQTAGSEQFDSSVDMKIHRLPLAMAETGAFSPTGCWRYWRLAQRIAQLCKERFVDEIHCARVVPEGWLAWLVNRMTGIPIRCYAHGEEINLSNASHSGVMSSRQHRWMAQLVLRQAKQIIANTHHTAELLSDDWHRPDSQLRVIHPGVDIERFYPAPQDDAVRDQLGWQKRVVILTVGRLQRRKGHDVLIAAMPAIRKAIPNVLYAIVGRGEEQSRLEGLVKEHGVSESVRFQDAATDELLTSCYQQCDLFVLPNRSVGSDIEGFGMVLLEAQACGKAVIAGDSGGTREAFAPGETGELVDCQSPEVLAMTIIDLLQNHAKRQLMETAARPWVQKRFGWAQVTQQLSVTLTEYRNS